MSESGSLPESREKGAEARAPSLREAIRRRAEEIYLRSGKVAGRDLENWKQAEQELARESQSPNGKETERKGSDDGGCENRHAVVIRVDGVKYVGEYREELAEGYVPGEFAPETPVTVRFSGDRMFVKRPNGKELETIIVEKTG